MVSPEGFRQVASPAGALMIGSPQEVIDKIMAERTLLGTDRFLGQADLGGLPPDLVSQSVQLFAREVAPAIRQETGAGPGSQPAAGAAGPGTSRSG